MWPDRVSNPGPLTYESGALLTAFSGPASYIRACLTVFYINHDTSKIKWYGIICIAPKADDTINVCKISKTVSSKLYKLENSNT